MSKLIALTVLAGALLIPAAAHAATTTKLHGVVVAKEASRHVLVVASARGKVTSARVTARQLRAARLGSRLALSGTRLADGSLHATRLRHTGRASKARLRVTVIKIHARKLLVAGGGSAFAIRLARGAHVLSRGGSGLHPGEKIETDVELGKNGAVGDDVQAEGDAVLIDFSGTVTALDANSITVTDDGIATVVQIPDGVTLPSLVQVGGEVDIVASISGTTLTLVEIKVDGDHGDGGGSEVGDDQKVEVHGAVTALDASSITIQPGDNATPVTFAIPSDFTLPNGLAVGSAVEAKGELVNDVLTLTKLELKNGDDDQGEMKAEGTVTALDSASIAVQSDEDGGNTITFAIPDGFTMPDGVQVGSSVEAKGEMVNGVLTLTEIELKDGDG
jgi:uncharacterized protein DUF5666